MGYTLPFVGEVVETGNLLYNVDAKSDEGKVLPIGSVRVRPIVTTQRGNLSLVYARPLTLSIGTPPLNGEHVLIFPAQSVDESSGENVYASYYYFPFPINITDDAVINQLPDYNFQIPKGGAGGGGGGGAATKNNLPVIPGKTFPFPVRPVRVLQPYEGDLIIQNRSGTSIRLGNGTKSNGQYAEQPEHHSTPNPGSPFFSIVCDEPNPPKLRPMVEIASAIAPLMNIPGLKKLSQRYRTELLKRIKTGMYGGLTLQLPNIILARACHTNPRVLAGTLPIPVYRNPQIALDSDRIVLNAKKDNAFMLARKQAIIEGEKVWLITARHMIDVDELIDELYAISFELAKLTSGLANFATPVGPTGPATNLLAVAAIVKRILTRFRHNRACPPLFTGGELGSPAADFGVNTNNEGYGNKTLPGPIGPSVPGAGSSPRGVPSVTVDPSDFSEETSPTGTGTGPSPNVDPITSLPKLIDGKLVPQVVPPQPGPGEEQPGGGGGGSNPLEECRYNLHMLNSNNNVWNSGYVEVFVDGESIGRYSTTNRSTLKEFKVKKQSKITLEYVKSINDQENSYVFALDGEVLYQDGPDPKQGKIYSHICKQGPVPVDNVETIPSLEAPVSLPATIINLSPDPSTDAKVILYQLESSVLNPDTGKESKQNNIFGLVISNGPLQGWHLIEDNPGMFKPSLETLLTSNKLASIECLTDELKRTPKCNRLIFTDSNLVKLPYTVPFITQE